MGNDANSKSRGEVFFFFPIYEAELTNYLSKFWIGKLFKYIYLRLWKDLSKNSDTTLLLEKNITWQY